MAGKHSAQSHTVGKHPAQIHMAGKYPSQIHMAGKYPAQSHTAGKHPAQIHMAGKHPVQIHRRENILLKSIGGKTAGSKPYVGNHKGATGRLLCSGFANGSEQFQVTVLYPSSGLSTTSSMISASSSSTMGTVKINSVPTPSVLMTFIFSP